MSAYTDRRDALDAAANLKGAQQRAQTIRAQMLDELRAAQAHTDDDLTPQGLASERTRLREQVQAKYEPRLRQLQASVDTDQATVQRWATSNAPSLSDKDAAQAPMIWDGIRARLDAGIPMGTILAGADRATVLVAAKYGPAHMEAASFRAPTLGNPYEAPDLTGFEAAVRDRLEQVSSGDEHDALQTAREAQLATAALPAMTENMAAHLSGSATNDLHAAVSGHYATEGAAHAGRAFTESDDTGDAA